MNAVYRIKTAIFMCATFSSPTLAQTVGQRNTSYLTQAAITETTEAAHIAANSPRPLLQAVDALRLKYGWVVSYEDPAYHSTQEIVENPNDTSQLLVPAGKAFDVEFPARSPVEDQTLRLLVDAYNQSTNPGAFELRQPTQGRFSIVGAFARNQADAISPQRPLLDTTLTIPTRQRTIANTLNLLCHSLALQNHVSVSLGIWPKALVAYTPVKIGGNAVPARRLLAQSLQAAPRNLYWCLLFDPASKGYVLDIHVAKS